MELLAKLYGKRGLVAVEYPTDERTRRNKMVEIDMEFSVDRSIDILAATPQTVRGLLATESAANEAGSSTTEWQPFDVVGHLIHGEVTDWVARARIILEQGENRTFKPFDRFAQFELSKGKSLAELLNEFERLRAANIETVRSWELTDEHLELEGLHPELGPVTLRQLLATWAVHDLNHIRQIATAMAKRYETEVGPWKQYLGILN